MDYIITYARKYGITYWLALTHRMSLTIVTMCTTHMLFYSSIYSCNGNTLQKVSIAWIFAYVSFSWNFLLRLAAIVLTYTCAIWLFRHYMLMQKIMVATFGLTPALILDDTCGVEFLIDLQVIGVSSSCQCRLEILFITFKKPGW